MARPAPIPSSLLGREDFAASVQSSDLVYFLCSVGDGDAQLILLPEESQDGAPALRRAIVVDACIEDKIPNLLRATFNKGLLGDGHSGFASGSMTAGSIALVVATHPHLDHIGGLDQVLNDFGDAITEFWDPGYFHTSSAYHKMMAAVENQSMMLYTQPTSGLRRWIGNVVVTVLSPSIQLRNRFDTYGVEINDSSISIKLDYPAARVQQRDQGRNIIGRRRSSVVLGADAQTLSWSYVLTDYPYLAGSTSDVAEALKIATGSNPLKGHILKVSHHASKHGVNLELVERIKPDITLVSSLGDGGSHGFPHTIAQELVREALDPTTSSGRAHKADHELGIFYTCDRDDAGTELGSLAVVVGKRRERTLWRFGDNPDEDVDLDNARLMTLS
jgi:hypothetical protein